MRRLLPGVAIGAGVGFVSMLLIWAASASIGWLVAYGVTRKFGAPDDPGLVSALGWAVNLGVPLALVGLVVAGWSAARRSGFLAVPVAALLAYGLSLGVVAVVVAVIGTGPVQEVLRWSAYALPVPAFMVVAGVLPTVCDAIRVRVGRRRTLAVGPRCAEQAHPADSAPER